MKHLFYYEIKPYHVYLETYKNKSLNDVLNENKHICNTLINSKPPVVAKKVTVKRTDHLNAVSTN